MGVKLKNIWNDQPDQHTCLHVAFSTVAATRGKASRERVARPRDVVVGGIVAIGTEGHLLWRSEGLR